MTEQENHLDAPAGNPHHASIAQLSNSFRARKLSPVEMLEAALKHSHHVDDHLNAFLSFDSEQAFAAARASEMRWFHGTPFSALDGVPLALKDTDHFRGQIKRSGSLSNADAAASDFDPPHIEGLRAAGAVVFARTKMADLGWKALGDSPLCGITRNPWNPELTPGGSSSGSAVAVATGCTPIATGTDGGGSIRIPAAFSGTFGIKPTLGRVPSLRDSPFLDMVVPGVLSACVEDASTALEMMARLNRRDGFAARLFRYRASDGPAHLPEGLRVFVSPGYGVLEIGSGQQEAVQAAARHLETLGAVISRKDPPVCLGVDDLEILWGSRMLGAAVSLAPEQTDRLDSDLAELVQSASAMPASLVQSSENRRRQQIRAMLDFMDECDLLLSAVAPVPPFAAGFGLNTPDPDAYPTWFHWAQLAWLLNIVGLPAASFPWTNDRERLPVGIQIAANPFREDLIRCVSLELARRAPFCLPDDRMWNTCRNTKPASRQPVKTARQIGETR